ncbi:phage tail assembly chaperone [Escherichia coli]|uniref:phage tail assembly chaperone n=1 Tax=Escherichia coli TaxID=562 RepID=UPI0037DD3848
MSKLVTLRLSTGDKLTFRPVLTEEGLSSANLLVKYPLDIGYNEETNALEISSGAMKYLLMSLEPDDLENLTALWFKDAKLNGHPVDFDDVFAGDYGVLTACLEAMFVENYSVFFTYAAKPFERPKFRYDEMVDTIYNTSITDNATKRMAPLDKVTEIIHSVYFSQMCKESIQYLKDMTLSDFWKLKVAIDIRESAKQEVDNRQYNVQKSMSRKK